MIHSDRGISALLIYGCNIQLFKTFWKRRVQEGRGEKAESFLTLPFI